MDNLKAKELLIKYNSNQCTEEERAWIESWYISLNKDHHPGFSDAELDAVEFEMSTALGLREEPHKVKLWPRIAVAVSVLILMAFGFYFFTYNQDKIQDTAVADIAPGGNKAVLVLADGKEIDLEQASIGTVMRQAGTLIKKNESGQLVYDAAGAAENQDITYNEMRTPRSGTYQLILPDGSQVWLNSGSSIKFPTTFSADERRVELKGEGYFEVVKNTQKPFKVVTQRQTVEVLGTRFNINAYTDEPVLRTTLVEGSVRVYNESHQKIIKPGEQSQLNTNNSFEVVDVDTQSAIAWKNGVFSFLKSDLKAALRQISRWYDVEVEYKGDIPNMSVSGKIYRSSTLAQTLKTIGYLDIDLSIEGRKVIVRPLKNSN